MTAALKFNPGDVFGAWTVLYFVGKYKHTANRAYRCRCVCGTERAVKASYLRTGRSTGCGCCGAYLEIDGVRKPTSQWAEEVGLSVSTVRSRLADGLSPKEALDPAPMNEVRLTHDGVTRSISEWAAHLGISRQALHQRLERGMPLEKALTTTSLRDPRAKEITYQGKTQSIAAWAKELGIHKSTLSLRLSLGWPLSKALSAERYPSGRHKGQKNGTGNAAKRLERWL